MITVTSPIATMQEESLVPENLELPILRPLRHFSPGRHIRHQHQQHQILIRSFTQSSQLHTSNKGAKLYSESILYKEGR